MMDQFRGVAAFLPDPGDRLLDLAFHCLRKPRLALHECAPLLDQQLLQGIDIGIVARLGREGLLERLFEGVEGRRITRRQPFFLHERIEVVDEGVEAASLPVYPANPFVLPCTGLERSLGVHEGEAKLFRGEGCEDASEVLPDHFLRFRRVPLGAPLHLVHHQQHFVGFFPPDGEFPEMLRHVGVEQFVGDDEDQEVGPADCLIGGFVVVWPQLGMDAGSVGHPDPVPVEFLHLLGGDAAPGLDVFPTGHGLEDGRLAGAVLAGEDHLYRFVRRRHFSRNALCKLLHFVGRRGFEDSPGSVEERLSSFGPLPKRQILHWLRPPFDFVTYSSVNCCASRIREMPSASRSPTGTWAV